MTTATPPVVAWLAEMEIPPSLITAIHEAAPGAEVIHTPYEESLELRTSRGSNGGENRDGLPTPELSDEIRAAWQRTTTMIVVDLPDDLGSLAPNLTWVQSAMAGYESYNLGDLAGCDIQLSTASGMGAASIAEFVMARLLQVWKHFRLFDEQQTEREWNLKYGTELTGRTIGIIGLGAIGREVAKRARAFGMRTVATRASALPGATDPDVDELYPASEIDVVLAQSDAVVSALPASEATTDLFTADRFSAMKEGAFFCNVGRGLHVVQADLLAALESGHLGAAALDVTRPEPLPPSDPLWTAPNLYLSPHCAISLDRYVDNFEALFMKNLGLQMAGEQLVNPVNLTAT